MPAAPLPTPQYINYDDNIYPLIGRDKVLVDDTDSTAITTTEADALIAQGEAIALEDLSPYYQTVPEIITTTGGAWTDLLTTNRYTYNILYNMMTYRASLLLIGAFIAKNTDEEGKTLSYFQKEFATRYDNILKRIVERLPNGGYKYLLNGLQPVTLNGIPRKLKRYAAGVNMGAPSYADHQFLNPRLNWDPLFGFNSGGL